MLCLLVVMVYEESNKDATLSFQWLQFITFSAYSTSKFGYQSVQNDYNLILTHLHGFIFFKKTKRVRKNNANIEN